MIVEIADENQLDPEATISDPLGGDILVGGNNCCTIDCPSPRAAIFSASRQSKSSSDPTKITCYILTLIRELWTKNPEKTLPDVPKRIWIFCPKMTLAELPGFEV